ncbi:molecular chaperone Hsc20 [Wolbachia endosymbiont of Diaphorina citri]|uniref:iron-sulfur cluster co-chaperone HscB C-terminal domain-containing protein n=1 Tax=Wolbachia endosymbiont of Diaphorina citri TaxID=116598 RepID=UPI0002D99424|nr:iron-sulfur cluster co-chaperone HscB C-terminal domain-containing protein [Wolbachia endosymbiont of Diaphorina citri]QJT94082.1 molecular chaperone Hsc20 [Wolbachia endosymbiont of Diaphorina citri]QJT95323.1 molecular chaperone Hsc20 [Wolbachia endosymbiont of Diaphorina citri]QJT96685.1 molecular chaperone Hsc20 [Wolbachia endosymbiont of Diaphorina citri]QLK10981.1 molecular chaperone Hsc20 [Wolbachia endosymbiont of Diaphorina citri]QXY87486.1 molecular chaperone Hsc20 [Wolbachia endo
MSSNHFTLFGIETAFHINFDELEKKYIELSRADINERESKNMENINKAYQILKSPLKRAEHLLSLLDVQSQENHSNSEILNESMEIREYLLDCDDLQFANRMINEKIKDCTKNLINAFATKNFDEATTQVLRLKYLYKSFEEIKENAASSNF